MFAKFYVCVISNEREISRMSFRDSSSLRPVGMTGGFWGNRYIDVENLLRSYFFSLFLKKHSHSICFCCDKFLHWQLILKN